MTVNYWAAMWGLLGALVVELRALWLIRERRKCPAYIKSWFYALSTIGMLFAGAVVAAAHLATMVDFNPVLALNLGAGTPALLQKLVSEEQVIPD